MRIRNYRRWLEALLLLSVATTVLLLLQKPLGHYLLKRDVTDKLNSLTYFYHERFGHIYDEIMSLDSLLDGTCSPSDIETIRNISEESAGIQLLEVQFGPLLCNQYGLEPTLFELDNTAIVEDSPTNPYRISMYKNQRLFLQIEFEKGTFRVITEPFQYLFIDHIDCVNCIAISLTNRSHKSVAIHPKADGIKYKMLASSPLIDGFTINVEANDMAVKHYTADLQRKFFWYIWPIIFFTSTLWGLWRAKSLTLVELIDQAIENSEFTPFYQPIIDAKSGNMIGGEVLVRWIKADGELIPPNNFIPLAENNGQIVPITEQLFQKVLHDIGKLDWKDNQLFASINVTPSQLEDPHFAHRILDIIDSHQVRASSIALEVTERTPFTNIAAASISMNILEKRGIEIKLDDAGTGYGGFSYLQKLPIHTLKIDKMFVDTVGTEDLKRNILQSIISFGHTAELSLIAEGVETKEQVAYLLSQKVHLMQGYYFAKPMHFVDFEHYYLSQQTTKVH